MCAVQGIECRRPLKSSPLLEEVVRRVRKIVPALGPDRVLAGDFAKLADAIGRGDFIV